MKKMTSIVVTLAVIAVVGCTPAEQPAEEPAPQGLKNGSFTANLNGFNIHYEVHGQGPVLMTLPNSWGLSLEGLRNLYRPLEEKLTMVYFDPRGMGESAEVVEEADMGMAAVRADFQALREHLGLDSVNAIGWSNGAMNLIYLASENPDTIDAAIFLHGAASFSEEDWTAWAQQHPELFESFRSFMEEMQDPELTDDQRTATQRSLWLDEWFPASFANPSIAAEKIDAIFGDAEFSWAHAEYSQRENPTFDASDQLPLITARCLVITGVHDSFPVSKGEEMAAGISGAQFALFEESGHYAPAEEPEIFEDLVFSFLGVN
jgi:proline iminopeptidase